MRELESVSEDRGPVCFGYFFKNILCRDIVEGKMKLHIPILMAIRTIMK